jgi:hypothetical protein
MHCQAKKLASMWTVSVEVRLQAVLGLGETGGALQGELVTLMMRTTLGLQTQKAGRNAPHHEVPPRAERQLLRSTTGGYRLRQARRRSLGRVAGS